MATRAFGRGRTGLTPPTLAIFALAAVLALLGALLHYRTISIPALQRYNFELLLAAFVLLAAGAVFRRI
jgi:hypothetical protein